MNRRELFSVIGATIVAPITATADCRNDKGMMMPDTDSVECLKLDTYQGISNGQAGHALFGFGAYETLLEYQKRRKSYLFTFDGKRYTIGVARLNVDVNREIGCVVCEVHGRLYNSANDVLR